jgi:hypothetical protein
MAASVCNAQLTLWLTADAPSVNGGGASSLDPVDTWTDAAGDLDLSGSGGSRPLWHNEAVNGTANNGFIRFDGSDDALSRSGVLGSSLIGSTTGSAFLVIRPATDHAANALLSWFTSTGNNVFQVAENNPIEPAEEQIQLAHGNFSGTTIYGEPEPETWAGNWLIVSAVRNGNEGTIRVAGANLGGSPDSAAFSGSLDTGATGDLRVGGFAGGGQFWSGDIAEILVYSSAADIAATENYLGSKYNLAPVPEPSQYATVFALALIGGAVALRIRRQRTA